MLVLKWPCMMQAIHIQELTDCREQILKLGFRNNRFKLVISRFFPAPFPCLFLYPETLVICVVIYVCTRRDWNYVHRHARTHAQRHARTHIHRVTHTHTHTHIHAHTQARHMHVCFSLLRYFWSVVTTHSVNSRDCATCHSAQPPDPLPPSDILLLSHTFPSHLHFSWGAACKSLCQVQSVPNNLTQWDYYLARDSLTQWDYCLARDSLTQWYYCLARDCLTQ